MVAYLHMNQCFGVEVNLTLVNLGQMGHFTVRQIIRWDFDNKVFSLFFQILINLNIFK